MFERYNEKARRVVFFARYEASQRSSGCIELEDLVLGALREDQELKSALPPESLQLLVEQLRAVEPSLHRPTATSVDLPLSTAAQRALAYGADEAELQGQEAIRPGHLVLGVLRAGESPASIALENLGLGLDTFREVVNKESSRERRASGTLACRAPEVLAPSLRPLVESLYASMSVALPDFIYSPKKEYLQSGLELDVTGESWTRKEALGHLIDLSMAQQQWLAAALAYGELRANRVPDRSWVEAQKYELDWTSTVNLWVLVNRHLLNVIASIPEDKLSIACSIGEAAPVSLEMMISNYVDTVAEWIRKLTVRPA